jgi:hypothetical protein
MRNTRPLKPGEKPQSKEKWAGSMFFIVKEIPNIFR